MQVIFNADDFGRSPSINAAVIKAHREGVLTSASLMVTGDAVEQAVDMAYCTPTLAVGLHLVVIDGRSVLPAEEIPHLVNDQGYFLDDPLRAGLGYFFGSPQRRELEKELKAQFERFAATGLSLSHVDGHLHMHLHPAVFNLVVPLALQYGAQGLRLPRDDYWFALRYDRQQFMTKLAWAFVFILLTRWCYKRLQGHRLAVTQKVYGLMQSGKMQEDYVVKLLRHLHVASAELYFHPDLVNGPEALGPNAGDLLSLLSPQVWQVVAERSMHLATYPTLIDD